MGDAILSSYYSLYFIHNGLDAHQQSLLLGLIPFALFLGCFVLSQFARGPKSTLWLFRACALIETALTFAFAFCHDFVSLAILTALLSFFNSAPFSFLESHSALAIEKEKIPYGRIRIFGTIGYIVSLFAGYFLLGNLKFEYSYFFSAGFFFVAFLLSFLTKPNDDKTKQQQEEDSLDNPQIKGIVLLLIAMALINGALGASTNILPIQLKSLGLPDADYSLIRSIGVGAEAVMMIFVPFFQRFFHSKKTPFYIAISGFALANALVVILKDPYAIGYSNLLVTGAAKAFLFSYTIYLFEDVCGKNRLSRIFTINSGLYNLTASALNLSSSYIYLSTSFGVYFSILAAIELAGLVVIMFVPTKGKLA